MPNKFVPQARAQVPNEQRKIGNLKPAADDGKSAVGVVAIGAAAVGGAVATAAVGTVFGGLLAVGPVTLGFAALAGPSSKPAAPVANARAPAVPRPGNARAAAVLKKNQKKKKAFSGGNFANRR